APSKWRHGRGGARGASRMTQPSIQSRARPVHRCRGAPSRSALEEDGSDGGIRGVRERDMDSSDAQSAHDSCRPAPEPEPGSAGRRAHDFDVGPAPTLTVAGPDRLEKRLFGGESRGEGRIRPGEAEAVVEFGGCEESAQRALAPSLDEAGESGHRNDVDPGTDNHDREYRV